MIRGGGNVPSPQEHELPMGPALEGLAKYEEELQVRDETNIVFNAKWKLSPSLETIMAFVGGR